MALSTQRAIPPSCIYEQAAIAAMTEMAEKANVPAHSALRPDLLLFMYFVFIACFTVCSFLSPECYQGKYGRKQGNAS